MEAGTDDREVRQVRGGPVPIFWAPSPAPFVGSLAFRVGRADETLRLCGITHLVEHLVHSRMDRRRYSFNAWVEGAYTVFVANGRPDEVLAHLQEVASMLSDLPLDRLSTERRVLSAESNTRSPGVESRLLGMRYGPTGFGLLANAELGVEWVGEEEVRDWTRQHFTAGNAALSFNAEPPPGFSVDLPAGERSAPPRIEVIPKLGFPAHVSDGTGGVATAMTVDRSTAATAFTAIAVERLHARLRGEAGISYSPSGSYLPLDHRVAHLMLNADCRDQDAERVQQEMVDILSDLASTGPTEDEIEWDRDMFERSLEDPERGMGFAISHARDHLMGFEVSDAEKLRAERQALTPETLVDVARAAMASLIVLVPDGVGMPARVPLRRYDTRNGDAIGGRVHVATPEWRELGDLSGLEISDRAVRFHPEPGGNPSAWAFEDLVAGVRTLSGGLTVVGRNAGWVTVDPHRYVDGHEVLATLEKALGPDRIVPLFARERRLAPVVERELPVPHIGHVAGEVDALVSVLDDEEEVRHLARAKWGDRQGLLVLTDRRLLWLFAGARTDLWEKPLHSLRLSAKGLVGKRLIAEGDGESAEFREIQPADRLREIVEASRRGL